MRGLNLCTEKRERNPYFYFQGTLSTGELWKRYMVALLKSYIPKKTFKASPLPFKWIQIKLGWQADLNLQTDTVPLWCGLCWSGLLYPAKEHKQGRAVTADFVLSTSKDKYPTRNAAACDNPLLALSLWHHCSCQTYLNFSVPALVLASVALLFTKHYIWSRCSFRFLNDNKLNPIMHWGYIKGGAEGCFIPCLSWHQRNNSAPAEAKSHIVQWLLVWPRKQQTIHLFDIQFY